MFTEFILYSAAPTISVPHVVEGRPHLQSVFQSQHSSFNNNRSAHTGDETALPINNARTDHEERKVTSDVIPLLKLPIDHPREQQARQVYHYERPDARVDCGHDGGSGGLGYRAERMFGRVCARGICCGQHEHEREHSEWE